MIKLFQTNTNLNDSSPQELNLAFSCTNQMVCCIKNIKTLMHNKTSNHQNNIQWKSFKQMCKKSTRSLPHEPVNKITYQSLLWPVRLEVKVIFTARLRQEHMPKRAWCLCLYTVTDVPSYRLDLRSPHISDYWTLLITGQEGSQKIWDMKTFVLDTWRKLVSTKTSSFPHPVSDLCAKPQAQCSLGNAHETNEVAEHPC